VTLGQNPSPIHVQSQVLHQLTGGSFSDEPEIKRKQILQNAMYKKNLLLVLDDVWRTEHESLLNVIDVDTGSKVLLSSRVRQTIEKGSKDTVLCSLDLPNEAEAVDMLLSTAGLSTAAAVPPQAAELVKLCKFLPLTISKLHKIT
jgi:hypothetical protein